MAKVKTAISIQESLFNEVDVLAHQLHIPRSQLFAEAVSEFIQKRHNRQIFKEINRAYGDVPDSREKKWQKQSKAGYRKFVEGEW